MNLYVLLAKQAIETYIREKKIISPPEDLPGEFLTRRAGTFVSIFRSPRRADAEQKRGTDAKKELRGCIGTYLPTKINIAQEIIHNAVAAATEDYRFGPIQEEELPYLSYTVYVLSEPELVKDISELNPQKFGIIIKTTPFVYPGRRGLRPLLHPRYRSVNEDVVFDGHVPFKSGLLLPDLEGIDTIEQQISIACQKGGINPGKEKIIIYRFTVKKYQ